MPESSRLVERVEALDVELFEPIAAQTTDWDRRALLALHAAVAARVAPFTYLEIGSYLGGSLQVVMRDSRCRSVLSIDPRPAVAPDTRGEAGWAYEDNSTEHMIELLRALPGVDLSKLTTFESSTSDLAATELPNRPDYCFVDGEHTDEAALRDSRFCAEALGGRGVVAFHDYDLVQPAIRTFLRETWSDVSMAVAFTGSVFAVELGGQEILRSPVIDRAVSSGWHSAVWKTTSRFRSSWPLLAAWSAIPALDRAAVRLREATGRRR